MENVIKGKYELLLCIMALSLILSHHTYKIKDLSRTQLVVEVESCFCGQLRHGFCLRLNKDISTVGVSTSEVK